MSKCKPNKRKESCIVLDDEEAAESKKQKCIADAKSSFTCPITYELFIDPVRAEDGQVYERGAIEDWFKRSTPEGEEATKTQWKSPMTNVDMGNKLLPATHTLELLTNLVGGGLLTGEEVHAWRAKREALDSDEADLKELQKGDADGDERATYYLGVAHYKGLLGQEVNKQLALQLFNKAAEKNYVRALDRMVNFYIEGIEVPQNFSHAMVLLMKSAMCGSKNGCYRLAHGYKNGRYGLPVDRAQATKWYAAYLSAEIDNASMAAEEKVKKYLGRAAVEEVEAYKARQSVGVICCCHVDWWGEQEKPPPAGCRCRNAVCVP